METDTRQTILHRWQSLDNGTGLKRATFVSRLLWVLGLVACLTTVLGVVYELPPLVIAVAAAAMGWLVAEGNALRSRLSQWPIIRSYIDWQRVQADSKDRDKKEGTNQDLQQPGA